MSQSSTTVSAEWSRPRQPILLSSNLEVGKSLSGVLLASPGETFYVISNKGVALLKHARHNLIDQVGPGLVHVVDARFGYAAASWSARASLAGSTRQLDGDRRAWPRLMSARRTASAISRRVLIPVRPRSCRRHSSYCKS